MVSEFRPDPEAVARDVRRAQADIPSTLRTTYAETRKELQRAINRRSSSRGGGQVRVARDITIKNSENGVEVIGGRRLPDWAGQEHGSYQFPQFVRYNPRGHIVGPLFEPGEETDAVGELQDEAIEKRLQRVWDD